MKEGLISFAIRSPASFLLALLISALFLVPAAHGETIKIGGTGMDLGTMRQMAEAFMKANPADKVTVVKSLGSSGGVRALLAGAIRRRGGPVIQQECDRHGPVAVGEAAVTTAGNLPARYVIHQASMRLGGRTTAESLAESTRAVLRLAEENGVRTLAFPATGTGIAGFALDRCAEIMLTEVKAHLEVGTQLTDVYFVLFDDAARSVFQQVRDRIST